MGIGGGTLQLLGDSILLIGGLVLIAREGDVELLGVLQSLVVIHALGLGVAILVRVNTSIVESEVVLVGLVPALLLSTTHGGPAALTLLLHGALGSTAAKIGSNDGASGLHVEEVGGQRALGGVGVKSTLLALLLLLLLGRGDGLRRGDTAKRSEGSFQVGERLIVAEVLSRGRKSEKEIGLAQIVISKGLNELLDGLKAAKSLQILLASCLLTPRMDESKRKKEREKR